MAKKKTSTKTETGNELALVKAEKAARRKRTPKTETAPEPGTKAEPETPTPDTDATPAEEQVVFAFRLARADRDAIHQAAGSGKASRFVKTLAIAAARGDIDTIHSIVGEVVRSK